VNDAKKCGSFNKFLDFRAHMPRIIQADLKEIEGNKYVRTGYFGR
jgi:hypothetical protein